MSKNSLTENQKAPDFCLPDQNENNVCLKDFEGKWIVLYFYPKDNTSGCTKEAQDFTALKDDFESENAIILGVSKDSIKSHIKFIEKKELGITLLSDEDTSIHQKYDVWRMKKNYGKEYLGTVRSTFLIDPEGNIAKIWDNVRVKEHAEKVFGVLREIQN
ncbi:thioredoxin-dependent thiol peroxidase [Methanolobus vulcani]|jgi:peroxiredoxin Q/BCP|uniref:thioredoxin-dependent peroxiredoxin n=1 Tax=Methanolobus vulcani TaxID=38026 RepID=A0A7Z8KQ36_9EURY|nr:thioredoxin-dependent thiol peroxidase [Methanolobus vulcani]TQD26400.1 thioredoxin-dependent thiol peroxidase [Methanolobus vulcani]